MEMALFAAWNVAKLSHFNNGKLPKFLDLLKGLRPSAPARPQTRQEILSALRAIAKKPNKKRN